MSTPKTPAAAKRLQSAKGAALVPGAAHSTSAAFVGGGLLDVFPVWSDQQVAEKEDKNAGKYEDPLGLSLPPAAAPFCDAWKRSEELLQGLPAVPMVSLKPAVPGDAPPAADSKKGKELPVSRELDGKLYAGHETFDWLLAVISHVMAAEKSFKKGDFLWELISPKDKDGLPVRSPSGRYRVKLFLLDTWRTVTVDDRIPLDLFGRSLMVGSRPLQLWPLLLCKAILKVMAVYRSLDMTLPHQVAAFHMLTGWPQEDLLDALGGTPAAGGFLFDRLEDVLPGPTKQITGLPAIASCCLVKRSKPQRAPPRLVVLSAASAVGRSQLVARLLAEFPDRFGVTVSHTSRPPKEHEVDGKDYYFTTKQQLLSDVWGKKFLEAARVAVHSRPCTSSAAAAAAAPPQPLSYWYGTSLATVREVAATGKLCVMSLDMQGAEALSSNKRIDGLYLYIGTSTPEVLAQRQKQRLAEAASTQAKKLAWAKQQVYKSSTAGLFDNVIPNTSLDEAYAALKEAISKLSPIIRNRLRGLPAYVLDYSDLISPNSVEKPFLKPVILSGPHTGERRRLLEMLVEEFPDVFALPRQHTTRPPDLHSKHVGVDGDELQLVSEQKGSRPHSAAAGAQGSPADAAGAPAAGDHPSSSAEVTADGSLTAGGSVSAGSSSADGGGDEGSSTSKTAVVELLPPPRVLSKEEFEAAVSSGQLLEHHADLFTHPLAVHRHGYSMADLQGIIKADKLPLLELEAEQTELVKVTKSVDCLSIFLAPPSLEEHEQRLQLAATESDQEAAARGEVAAAELAAARAQGVFDEVLVNDDFEEGYAQLKAAISRFRPDLIPPAATDAAARAAQQAAAASTAVPLLVAGPAGAGRDQLVQQLLQRFSQRFAVPRQVTDRKPGKGEKEAAADVDFVKPDVLSKFAAQGQVVWSSQDAAAGGSTAVTAEAVGSVLAAGKLAVLDVGSITAAQLQSLKQHPALKQAFTVYVSRLGALKASLAASGVPEAAAEQTLANMAATHDAITTADGLVQAVVTNDDAEEAFTQLQVPLSASYPWAVPPLLQPLVVAGPFGSGKRSVLQRLVQSLPDVLAVPKVVTSKPHTPGREEGMEVVSLEAAQQMRAAGQFLVHQEVLGHIYGIPSAAVRKLQALGKLPLLDLDRVQDVEQLRAAGFQATYLYLQPHSVEALQARIRAEILANPPLLYEPDEAATKAAAEAAQEAEAAASKPQLFDAVVPLDPQDQQTALGKLGLELHQRYPFVVPSSFVWGFGRPLWDPAARVLGLKPLRVMVLGPAASGKSMQCSMLAERFAVPHINVGDLLYAEVAAKTPLGLEAQRHMDSSKTVPDKLLMRLLLERLKQQDCQTCGWVLDGFPHTRKQAQELADAGHVPDKVVLLEGPHALLLNRVKYRRVDYTTGKVYHLAEAGSLSEAVKPLKPDGSVDADVLARLSVRHDDSLQNVANRLALWDRQVQGLRAAYEDVTLRLPADGSPAAIFARAESFVRLEAELPSGPDAVSPGSVWPLVQSWELEELTYRVVSTVRYKRHQLVQLQQLNGKLFWCNLKELAGNSSCMLLAHNTAGLPVLRTAKRLDTSSIQQQQLLMIDSPEPFKLLTCLSMGPQHLAMPPSPPSKQVFVLVGPTGAGRTSLARLLLNDYPSKLVAVPLLTNRPPQPLDVARVPELGSCMQTFSAAQTGRASPAPAASGPAGASSVPAAASGPSTQAAWPGTELLRFVPEQHFRLLHQSQQLMGLHQHMHHSYAVPVAAIEDAAEAGKAALLVGSVHLAAQLKSELPDMQVVCVYVDADVGSLDKRIRQQAELDEQQLQALLADAGQQKSKLQALQEQREQPLCPDQLQGSPSVPPSPAPAAAAGAKGTLPGAKLTVQLPQMSLPSSAAPTTARAGQQQQQHWLTQPDDDDLQDRWLFCVANQDAQLQVCYTHIKFILAKFAASRQQFQPGLLLLQRHPASAAYAAAAADRPVTARQAGGSATVNGHHSAGSAATAAAAGAIAAAPTLPLQPEAAALIGAAVSALGLDDDAFSTCSTVQRLKALTAASGQLVLPRGRHLLQVQCCHSQLHCVTFHASTDFTLDSADKLLPSACKMHVERQSGDTALLPAGSRQLLFRYLIKPLEPCSVSIQFQAASTALQASTQLMLLEVATGRPIQQLQQQSVLLPPSPKGYLLLALCEPVVDVPSGVWSVVLTSDRKLPALAEVPCSRQLVFSGVYAPNTKAVMARFVISPTTAVNLAVLAQLRLTAACLEAAGGSASAQEPPQFPSLQLSGSPVSGASSSSTDCSLKFAVQVFDTAGAKEVAWHASYQLLASVQSQGSGRVSMPNLHLAPGKYLVVLQLLQDGSRQWVDPATGSTSPLPEWQLLVMPGADDKACPIVQDDAWERHFEASRDAWQQQAIAAATAAAAAAGANRPGSSNSTRAALAAAKERAKTAQAALERHMASVAAAAASAEQQVGVAGAAAASSAAAVPSARVSTSGAASATTTQQAAVPVHAATSGGAAAAVKKPAPAAAAASRGKAAPGGASAASGTRPVTPQGAAVTAAAQQAAVTPGTAVGVDAGQVLEPPDSSSSQQLVTQAQLWPGAVFAAVAPPKPPTEVVIRQVKGSSTDALQLSPADQLKEVALQHHAANATSSDQAPGATNSSSSKQPSGGAAVLTPAVLEERLQQLRAAADARAQAVEKAANDRGQLHAAAAHLAEQQVQSFTGWREQTLASQQAILQRKQGMLQSMFAPPVPLATMGGPSAAPAAGTAVKSGAERIPAGKSSK